MFARSKASHDKWLEEMIEVASPLDVTLAEASLIKLLLDRIYGEHLTEQTHREYLAAAFDLVVAAQYYAQVAHAGWSYCPDPADEPAIFYPYTNVCPRCVLHERFVYCRANKPQSGVIGAKASRLLLIFLQHIFTRKGNNIQVLKGNEPVDSIFIDRTTVPPTVLFAEIKAAPLVTLPLMADSQLLTAETELGTQLLSHHRIDFLQFLGSPLSLFLPSSTSDTVWHGRRYALGCKKNAQDRQWAFRGLRNLIEKERSFLPKYFSFWRAAFHDYGKLTKSPIYWLTNACGQPNPRPDDWPRRKSGKGYESVSDSKTSAGMDRTDDLKKATYQVLKLGANGKPSDRFSYKVGIVSNIHAVRHFEEYLQSLKDIIWTKDNTGKATTARELPPETELFNLFDGIISLTQTQARDKWVKATFRF